VIRWLVTRPAEEAERFGAAMREAGLEPVFAPLLSIEPVDPGPIDYGNFAAILLTSRNGARRLAALAAQRHVPILAVGRATAALARHLGFLAVESADGDGIALAALARRRFPAGGPPLLHLRGEAVGHDVAASLEAHGYRIERAVAYRAVPANRLPPIARDALLGDALAGVAFFSPATAEVFARLARDAGIGRASLSRCTAACLGEAVAVCLDGSLWGTVRIASRPDASALLETMVTLPPSQSDQERPDGAPEGVAGPAEPATVPSDPVRETGDAPASATEPGPDAESGTPTARIVEAFGGAKQMAAYLTIPVSTVQGWKRRNAIPHIRHSEILAAAAARGIVIDADELARTAPAEEQVPPPVESPPVEPGPFAEPVTSVPANAPASMPNQSIRAPAASSGSIWVAATVAVVAAVASITAPLWSPELLGVNVDPRIEQSSPPLPDRIAFLEKRIGEMAVPPAEVIESLTQRLDTLEQSPPPAGVDLGAIEQGRAELAGRIDGLAARIDQIAGNAGNGAGDGAALSALEGRIGTLEGARQEVQALGDRIAALEGARGDAEALDGRVAALEQVRTDAAARDAAVQTATERTEITARDLVALSDRVAAIETRLAGLAQTDAVAQAAVLAAGQIGAAVDSGAPYAAPLESLRRAAAQDTALAAPVETLARTAETGVATGPALADAFPAAADAARRAERQARAQNWVDRSLAVVEDLVVVRPAPGEVDGDDTDSVLARAEGRLDRGDLPGAVAALGALQGPAAEAMAGWVGQARARLAAQEAVARIAAAAIARIGGTAQTAPAP
jgi:uroporphyrinogen-III synthase